MSKKILVADDDISLVALMEAVLELQGFGVVTAHDGLQAVSKALQEKPDLILLDVQMPGLEGHQVFEKLQEDPCVNHIPAIVISGHPDVERLFPRSKLLTFVVKPFTTEHLLGVISQVIPA